MLPTLTTPRLHLRALDEADVPALFRLFSTASALHYWSHVPFAHPDQAAALLKSAQAGIESGTSLRWGVAEASDLAQVIGTASLYQIDLDNRRAEVGFILAPALWGRGYGGEVIGALIGYAFSSLALYRLEADVDPRNTASLRALERHGFQREGYLRARYRVGGEVQDSVLLGLLRDEAETE